PCEDWLTFIDLKAEVAGHVLRRHRPEPHRLEMIIEDQRTALTLHRRMVQVVEVRGEDVAGGEFAGLGGSSSADDRRSKAGLRGVAVGIGRRVRTERRPV